MTLKSFSNFSSICYWIFLVPDSWMALCVDLLDVSLCCESRPTDLRGSVSADPSRLPNNLASSGWLHLCLPKFLCHTCDDMPVGGLFGNSYLSTFEQYWWNICGKRCIIFIFSAKELHKAIHFCYQMRPQSARNSILKRNVKETFSKCDAKNPLEDRVTNRFTASVANVIEKQSVFVEKKIYYMIIQQNLVE